MKVNNSGNKMAPQVKTDSTSTVKSPLAGSSRKAKSVEDLIAPDASSSARVDLSTRAQDTKKATEIARQGLNDVDEAKVAKYQALIDGGKYKVDSAKVADRMIEEHLSSELAAGETKD